MTDNKYVYDGIMVVLDSNYSREQANIIKEKILKIIEVENAALAITNIEKVISTAEEEIKDVGHMWIRINKNFAGILEKDGKRRKK